MSSDAAQTAMWRLVETARERAPSRPLLIGLAGPQGAGKSTLGAAVRKAAAERIVSFSLDDVYLSAARRAELAADVHPLLRTRGPPGTHDLGLLNETIDRLTHAAQDTATPIPYFDKLADEPAPRSNWENAIGPPNVILVDGWCIGATTQTTEQLRAPINQLEATDDRDGAWRGFVNDQLGVYQALFARFDAIAYLQPPSFEIVLDWRSQQEEGLLGHRLDEPGRARIARFIAHFERITRHMMAGGRRADVTISIDENRTVRKIGGQQTMKI